MPNKKDFSELEVTSPGLITPAYGQALIRALRSLRILDFMGQGCRTEGKNTGEGEILNLAVPAPAVDNGCCGLSEAYYSSELNAAFEVSTGSNPLTYNEVSGSAYSGMTIVEGTDGIFVATLGGDQWTGSDLGISGVEFTATAGSPTVTTFTLQAFPPKLTVEIGGTKGELEYSLAGSPFGYTGGGSPASTLSWDPFSGTDGQWQIDSGLYTRDAKIHEFSGEYDTDGAVWVPGSPGGRNNEVPTMDANGDASGDPGFQFAPGSGSAADILTVGDEGNNPGNVTLASDGTDGAAITSPGTWDLQYSGSDRVSIRANDVTFSRKLRAGTNNTYDIGDTTNQFRELHVTTAQIYDKITDDNGNELVVFTATGSAVNYFTLANAATGNGVTIGAGGTDTDVGITLTPKGAGNITLGNFTLDADQTVGAGQDNYVLTYDHSTGLIALEAAAGGGSGTASDPEYKTLAADFTSSSTTLADVDNGSGDDLVITLSANTDYEFRAYIIWDSSASGEGFDLAINGPTSPTDFMALFKVAYSTTGERAYQTTSYDDPILNLNGSITNRHAFIFGKIEVGGTGGALAVRFAAETGGANNATVKAGSSFIVREISAA